MLALLAALLPTTAAWHTQQVACVGDSITYGAHSTGGNATYPGQLQIILDEKYGKYRYNITNLGNSGKMMLKKSCAPWWKTKQYEEFVAKRWDIVIIMLGTNDAHNTCNEPASREGCTSDWSVDCGGPNKTSLKNCQFAEDFADLVKIAQGLGVGSASPQVYVMIPPPLMSNSAGWPSEQTTINTLFPKLFPMMAKTTPGVHGLIDVFTGMGGNVDWKADFPTACGLNSSWAPCQWFCDKQSCDECHPNNYGYTHLASVVAEGLNRSAINFEEVISV